MKQGEEERSILSWKNLLERLLDHLGLKLVILEPDSFIIDWISTITDASGEHACIIHNLPSESIQRTVDDNCSIIYPKGRIPGSSEEEACSRMLKAIVGAEVRWLSISKEEKEEKDSRKTFVTHVVEVPRISTSSIYAARMSLDVLLG